MIKASILVEGLDGGKGLSAMFEVDPEGDLLIRLGELDHATETLEDSGFNFVFLGQKQAVELRDFLNYRYPRGNDGR